MCITIDTLLDGIEKNSMDRVKVEKTFKEILISYKKAVCLLTFSI